MRSLYFLFLAFFLAGCVTTETTGFIDPDYRDSGYEVSKVVVRIDNAGLDETLKAEQLIADEFKAHGIEVIKYTDIVPPTRSPSKQESVKLIQKTGADSTFIITVSKDVVDSYVPATYHPGTTTSTVHSTPYGGTYTTTSTSPGFTTGGYSTSNPVVVTLSTLIDNNNWREVWRAEGSSHGDATLMNISFLDLIISAGKDAMADMRVKKLLPELILEAQNTNDKAKPD